MTGRPWVICREIERPLQILLATVAISVVPSSNSHAELSGKLVVELDYNRKRTIR